MGYFMSKLLSPYQENLRQYLKRAFAENRGAEAILLIMWRRAQVRHIAGNGVARLKEFEMNFYGQPRAVRALNMLEEMAGRTERYGDAHVSPNAVQAPMIGHNKGPAFIN